MRSNLLGRLSGERSAIFGVNGNHGVGGRIDSVMAMPSTTYRTLATDIRAGAHYDPIDVWDDLPTGRIAS